MNDLANDATDKVSLENYSPEVEKEMEKLYDHVFKSEESSIQEQENDSLIKTETSDNELDDSEPKDESEDENEMENSKEKNSSIQQKPCRKVSFPAFFSIIKDREGATSWDSNLGMVPQVIFQLEVFGQHFDNLTPTAKFFASESATKRKFLTAISAHSSGKHFNFSITPRKNQIWTAKASKFFDHFVFFYTASVEKQ